MSWKQWFAWPIHRIREGIGTYPYTRPQRYKIGYRLLLSVKEAGLITLAIPLPRPTAYQQVHDLVIQLPDAKEMEDPVFGNRFLVTTLYAPVGQLEMPAFHADFEVLPRVREEGAAHSSTGGSSTKKNMVDARVQALAERIGHGSCARETAERINAYIVDHLVYGDPIDGLYSDVDALTRPRVDCGGFVSLFVSLCLAQGISARIVSGFWLDGIKNDMHAWAEFQTEQGHWIPVDPSVQQLARQGRTKKSGRFSYVGSDRLTLSVGSPIPLHINNTLFYAPLLQHPFMPTSAVQTTCRGRIQLSSL